MGTSGLCGSVNEGPEGCVLSKKIRVAHGHFGYSF